MKFENHKIRYGSMEDALDAICGVSVMLEGIKRMAENGMPCPEELYRSACAALDMLQDVSLLGQRLAAGLQPDGSVELPVDDDAWQLMAEQGMLPQ